VTAFFAGVTAPAVCFVAGLLPQSWFGPSYQEYQKNTFRTSLRIGRPVYRFRPPPGGRIGFFARRRSGRMRLL